MKIMIIDFVRHNPWGTTDMATHYYVDGKRIKQNDYYRFYSVVDNKKWKHMSSNFYSKNKDGITRDYTIINYKENVQ